MDSFHSLKYAFIIARLSVMKAVSHQKTGAANVVRRYEFNASKLARYVLPPVLLPPKGTMKRPPPISSKPEAAVHYTAHALTALNPPK